MKKWLSRIVTSVSQACSHAKFFLYSLILSWLEYGPKERLKDHLRIYVHNHDPYTPIMTDRHDRDPSEDQCIDSDANERYLRY